MRRRGGWGAGRSLCGRACRVGCADRGAALPAGAGAAAFAQGVGEACSHGSMREDPSHEQRFRPATAISWGRRRSGARRAGVPVARPQNRFGILEAMNPARKRTVRLVVALERGRRAGQRADLHELQRRQPGAQPRASCCARRSRGAATSSPARSSQGSVRHAGDTLDFSVADRAGGTAIPVAYTRHRPGPVPRRPRGDRDGRRSRAGSYVGERDSLITKCPSKYKTAPAGEKQNYAPTAARGARPDGGSASACCWRWPSASTASAPRCTACAPAASSSPTPGAARCTRWRAC